MKMSYSYNEMKRAFECGRNFQLTGENNFQELIEELNQALSQLPVIGNCRFYEQDNTTAMNCKHCGKGKWMHGSGNFL
jgi:hypothetical protein